MNDTKKKRLMKRQLKILGIVLSIFLISIGSSHFITGKWAEKISANTGLNLSSEAKEVSVNTQFVITVQDTDVVQSSHIGSEKVLAQNTDVEISDELELEEQTATHSLSKTTIKVPVGIEYDEVGTKQINDGNKIATILYDESNRDLSIDWTEPTANSQLEVSLTAQNIGEYQLSATKIDNKNVIESNALIIEVNGLDESAEKKEVKKSEEINSKSSISTFLEVGTAVVNNAAELNTAIKDLTISTIYFGQDINLNQSIQIPNGKQYLRISGKNPETGEIHTLTENNGLGLGTRNMYVSNNNSDPKDYGLSDMKIIGRNYYGPLNVQDNTKEVTLSYTNIDYQGPQITHNVNGITKYIGDTKIYIARVQSSSDTNQEVAEARDVIMDGNITIDHTSNGDSMFWLGLSGGAENSFTVKENSNVTITSKGNGMFYRDGSNPITMDVEKNANLKITSNNGLFRNNPGKYLHIDENATMEFEKTGGDQPVLRLTEDVKVDKGARFVMKATGGSGNFARFEKAYSGTNLNFDNPRSVLLYNKTSQQMFAWTGGGNSSGKMHIDAPLVNYWRVAGTGNRDDLPLFSWSMPDKSNVVTDLTTNGAGSTVINSTNSGMNANDFNLGSGKVISFGTIDVTLDPITDAQNTITGTASKDSKVYIDYNEEGVSKTLTGMADAEGKYSIAIPNGFIKPYISVTATANLDFNTKISDPVIVQDITAPEGVPIIQVLDIDSQFPTDISKFVKDVQDKSDGTSGSGVTIEAGKIPQPDMSKFGPVLPSYEVVLTDKAGNLTTIKVPIFIKDKETEVSGTKALRAKDIDFKLSQYPKTEADLNAFIQEKSNLEVWDLVTGNAITDLSTVIVDTSKMREAVGVYPVTFTFGDVSKETQVAVTPDTGIVNVRFQDELGNKLAEDKVIIDDIGTPYSEQPIDLNGYEYLRTEGDQATGIINDQTQEVIFIYKQNRFKLNQSVTNLNGSSVFEAALSERIEFKTELNSQLSSTDPTVFYNEMTIQVPIDSKLTNIGEFSLKTPDGVTRGTVTYDEVNRLLTATIKEEDQVNWSENLTLIYQGTVKDGEELGTIISSKAEASGNYTNDWIADSVESNRTETKIIDGKLFFISAPGSVDFGDGLKIAAGEKKYPLQTMTGSLTIRDTRSIKASWTLTAKMNQVLTSSTDKTLPNALKYTKDGTQFDLGKDSIIIYENTNNNSAPINISDKWIPNGDGLSIEVEPGQVYPEEYNGSITWMLQDTP